MERNGGRIAGVLNNHVLTFNILFWELPSKAILLVSVEYAPNEQSLFVSGKAQGFIDVEKFKSSRLIEIVEGDAHNMPLLPF